MFPLLCKFELTEIVISSQFAVFVKSGFIFETSSDTMSECEEMDRKVKLQGVTRLNRNLQSNEVLTLHYLGLPYLVLCRRPVLRLKVPLSTYNFQDGETDGIALQLIFTCPVNYPLQLPRVDLAEKRNVSTELDLKLRTEIAKALEQHLECAAGQGGTF
ncbi:uncharacterized protein LOC111595455 isoform X2 [Drosophila hydei]|uniref:Uncharacterized protein LOC111595455 isoform X2 n=1 Tax=Drosophila hydei TaxID=7224 RepID=A0A6J2T0R5_DROHY|nr:uncharacterized protein LOC111595455 isoform X2 [Drosophila hydei]